MGTIDTSSLRCREDFSEALWRRARLAGADSIGERRQFGFADDIYSAGLLTAFLCFVPFCKPGAVDGVALQRLFESTLRLDFEAIQCGPLLLTLWPARRARSSLSGTFLQRRGLIRNTQR